ncbi:MAG: flagellar hook-length control protein FliK [Agathobacter sp.]|nr:flagellar hook-length control protein FliK [Agathobacter sp.]
MTTANLMNVPSVNAGYAAQTDASKKLQDENLKVAEVFAGLMNPNVNFSNQVVDETSSNMDVKTDGNQSAANSYERYSYKDNKIDEAKTQDVSEKLEESSETLEQAEQDVVNAIAEEYGVSEEEINKLLEEMGLNVLDLLNPQNLVNFIVQLTGVASGEELLLDESFLKIMETLDNLAEGLMKELNVDMEGLQALIDQMDVVDTETQLPVSFQENLDAAIENVDAQENLQANGEEAKSTEIEVEVEVEKQEENTEVKVENNETEDVTLGQKTKEDTAFTNNQNSDGNSLLNHQSNANETIVTQQTNSNISQVADMSHTQFSSYMSADTVQIIEQIVQQMRVTISAETTSMEMQLNPENLGKVYVNISSEEGVVNAQFHATNEVVKEALEAQIATLRENLNQAGVKVDAIEVTIASHEFERNLEQNQQNPEEHKEVQETSANKRRNISIDSLDELSGVMTEEENLVAQMMKDNGNSVDFTA